jgi:hypothetical protein
MGVYIMKKTKRFFLSIIDWVIAVYIFVIILYGVALLEGRTSIYNIPSIGKTGFIHTKDGHALIIKKTDYKLNDGDTITYLTGEGNFSAEMYTEGFKNADKIVGKVVLSVPYLGYLGGFLGTKLGRFILIIIPTVGILLYSMVFLIDEYQSYQRRRRRYLRRRKKRRERYVKEGFTFYEY